MIIVCDIDGTLSNNLHREHHLDREPADWEAFYQACDGDLPIQQVIRLVHSLWMAGHRIIVVSGRPERVRSKTVLWLDDQGIPHEKLLMRADDDLRPSHVFKLAAAIEHVAKRLDPGELVLAIDDNEADCAAYRELGFVTMKVERKA